MSTLQPLKEYIGLQEAATRAFAFPEQWYAPVCSYLTEILTICGPTLSPESIERRIREEKGTILEPMHFEEKGTILEPMHFEETDFRVLGLLGALAFSRMAASTRFRIVSRDTLGEDGGLIFLPSGKAYFAPRFGVGNRAPQKKFTGGLAAPALAARLTRRTFPSATARFEENSGLQITMEWRRDLELPFGMAFKPKGNAHKLSDAQFIQALQQNSSVAGSEKDTFDRLGFQLAYGDSATITLTTGSSEAMMRLIALCSQNAILRIAPQKGNAAIIEVYSDLIALYVRLALPEDQSQILEVIPVYQSANRSYGVRLPSLRTAMQSTALQWNWPSIAQRLPALDMSQSFLALPPEFEANAPALLTANDKETK